MTSTSSDGREVARSRPEEHIDRQRERILRAALRCLAVSGYSSVRLRDISREAGVSIGSLQHYFDNRELLLEQAFEQMSNDLLDRWHETGSEEPDPWRRMVLLLDQFAEDPDVRTHCAMWMQFCVNAAAHDHLHAGLGRVYASWQGLFADAIAQGVAEERFRPVMPQADVVSVLLAQIDGFELAIASGLGSVDGHRMRDLVLQTAATLLGYGGAAPEC